MGEIVSRLPGQQSKMAVYGTPTKGNQQNLKATHGKQTMHVRLMLASEAPVTWTL